MRPAASKAAGKEKGRRKGGAAGGQLLTDQVLSLRARLHNALALGLAKSDGRPKKWQSTCAGVQSHVLRAATSFIGCLSNELMRLPPIKESISDILIALEGILQSKNESVLIPATDVSFKLVSTVGNLARQYPILEIVTSLSCQLAADQIPIIISSASAMNGILNTLATARGSVHIEIWEALEKTGAVLSVSVALQNYSHDVHPLNYLMEMMSLLRIILWIWPSSRYHVWSNSNLMGKLAQYCVPSEIDVAVRVIKLYAAIALCGNGAMTLLKNEELMAKVVRLMGKSHPCAARIEALKFCQILLRSSKGCDMLMARHGQHITEGIVNAMSTDGEKMLITEGCRTALLVLRNSGDHHRLFWSNAIDDVLYNILTSSCISSDEVHQILSHDELVNMVLKNFMDIHTYVWDILGNLAVHCNNEYLSVREGKGCALRTLIHCVCSVATDAMQKSSTMKLSKDVHEPALRAVLMMLLSSSGYILSEASSKLLQVFSLGDDCLNILFTSLESNTTRSITASFDSVKIMSNLMSLAGMVMLQPSHNLLNTGSAVAVLSTIIKECLHNNVHLTRSKVASHLQFCFDGVSCCTLVEEWEGDNIALFYGLMVLFNLLKSINFVCIHCKRNLDMGIVCSDCRDHYSEDLIRVLQNVLCQNLSSGPKLYISHILSLFGLCGFPSKLGGKMKGALDDSELADLELLLSDGESLKAHSAIISVRCPKLLPSVKSLGSDGKITDEWDRPFYRVRMSDRVDSFALKKILEYAYTSFVMVDDNVKTVRTLAKYCHLKSLQEMLQKNQPRWNSDCPRYDLTAALAPVKNSFSDIILEAQSNEEMKCGLCQLSTPHVHCHKIVLSMNCDYLRALFQSGMHESFSEVIKVPIGRQALDKLVHWFYSGDLPKITPDCRWRNLNSEEQLSQLRPYAELSSLAEFWFLEGVKEESLAVVTSCLSSTSTAAAVELVGFAAQLEQWEMVEAAVGSVAHLYPKLRDSGQLEQLDDDLLDMLRTEYVRYSQHGGRSNRA
ncbi:BTB/POZ domain-containing protein At1g04390 [Oryza brachyantha]|uniref:BTB domain-containing protein n=1 Tax=Oryza brachyantha TaxID=4533 RepID=J3MGT0_ORYBR|nr:BTB/POZ domain-containing protein At1g04390 [Oryza brachyantha]